VDYSDNAMTKLIVNNGTDALQTDINLLFTITNCRTSRYILALPFPLSLADASLEFQIHVSLRILKRTSSPLATIVSRAFSCSCKMAGLFKSRKAIVMAICPIIVYFSRSRSIHDAECEFACAVMMRRNNYRERS